MSFFRSFRPTTGAGSPHGYPVLRRQVAPEGGHSGVGGPQDEVRAAGEEWRREHPLRLARHLSGNEPHEVREAGRLGGTERTNRVVAFGQRRSSSREKESDALQIASSP